MKNFIYQRQWNWRASGIAFGLVFLLAVTLVKPIGVSTQFVIFDGIIWNVFSEDLIMTDDDAESGYSSPNHYLNKSGGTYAKNIANPFNYGFIFVIAMIAGGFIAGRLQSDKLSKKEQTAPALWYHQYGNSPMKRYLATFAGGALVLFGARLAVGCTSGHMMSGMMQTSLSGYLFALGAFSIAIPAALILFRGGE